MPVCCTSLSPFLANECSGRWAEPARHEGPERKPTVKNSVASAPHESVDKRTRARGGFPEAMAGSMVSPEDQQAAGNDPDARRGPPPWLRCQCCRAPHATSKPPGAGTRPAVPPRRCCRHRGWRQVRHRDGAAPARHHHRLDCALVRTRSDFRLAATLPGLRFP